MVRIKGNGVGREIIEKVVQISLGTEILYSFIIIAISLMIYFGTRELYDLSSHKGIKYFRLAFLYFAIAFFFRSFIKFLLISFNIQKVFDLSVQTIGGLSLLLFMYASAMAIFYLLCSVMWKKWNKNKINLFHLLALVIAITTVIIKNSEIVLLMHLILFVFIIVVIVVSYQEKKKKRKHNHLHGIYILFFVFWILNIIDLIITNVFNTFQILIYLASISTFFIILYKVLRKVG